MTSRNPRSLTESEARGVFKAVVDALVYLARESILHRDIKADNILLTEDGRIVSYKRNCIIWRKSTQLRPL
jgi:serine/threonine protein kinase